MFTIMTINYQYYYSHYNFILLPVLLLLVFRLHLFIMKMTMWWWLWRRRRRRRWWWLVYLRLRFQRHTETDVDQWLQLRKKKLSSVAWWLPRSHSNSVVNLWSTNRCMIANCCIVTPWSRHSPGQCVRPRSSRMNLWSRLWNRLVNYTQRRTLLSEQLIPLFHTHKMFASAHARTHVHTHTRTRTHVRTHARTHSHIHTHTDNKNNHGQCFIREM